MLITKTDFGVASLNEKLGSIGCKEPEDVLLFSVVGGAGGQCVMDSDNRRWSGFTCRSSVGAFFAACI